MKQIFKRLRSRAGETLVESMAAILIFTMGSIIMLSMVSTAAGINETAKKEDDSYNSQIIAAEMTEAKYQTSGQVKIIINGTSSEEMDVDVFAYRPQPGEEPVQNPLYTFYKANEVLGAGGGSK